MAASTVIAPSSATLNHSNSSDGGAQTLLSKQYYNCNSTGIYNSVFYKNCNRNNCKKSSVNCKNMVVLQNTVLAKMSYNYGYLLSFAKLLYLAFHSSSLLRLRSLKWDSTPLTIILFFLTVNTQYCNALKSSMTYVPQGTNTLLYRPGGEPIMQLDQVTFADTVFEQGRTQAFLVEFYADWCGHCRAFAPFYRELSSHAYNWRPVVQIAAMNCADNFNSQVCGANGVTYFPMIKYFPRSATGYADGMALEASHSVDNLLDQLSSKIINENQLHAYPDWPNFKFIQITHHTRFDDLWEGAAPTTNFLVIVFESLEQSTGNSAGFRLIFELLPYRNHVLVRRALSNSPLASMLRLTVFPYAAMFRRGDQQSIFMEPIHEGTSQSVLSRAQPGQMVTIATTPPVYVQSTTASPVFDCDARPERCKPLYFVSESDMLRAMHMALVDEVARPNGLIRGRNFTHLYNFVTLLTDYFPVFTFENDNKISKDRMRRAQTISGQSLSTKTLRKSDRARRVFAHMKSVLEARKRASGNNPDVSAISSTEWRNQFTSVERLYENPFPVNASWQHCRGTTPDYRGYTCALWTTFHMLTVHTYLHSLNNGTQKASAQIGNSMRTLKAIQGWVESFFGCNHCRNHFMEMTTEKFPMNESKIRRAHDAMLYLWRAHNIVNKRLHGQSTEDPQFLKYQFPPPFLCPTCNTGGSFSRRQVRAFLINYYSNIRPAAEGDNSAPADDGNRGGAKGSGGEHRRRVRLPN